MVVSHARHAAVTLMLTCLLTAPLPASGAAPADATVTSTFLSQEDAPAPKPGASIESSRYGLVLTDADSEKTKGRARFTPTAFAGTASGLSVEGRLKDLSVTDPHGEVTRFPDQDWLVPLDSVRLKKDCKKLEIVREKTGRDGGDTMTETLKLTVEDRKGREDKGPLCDIAAQFTDGDFAGAATALNDIVDFK
jgi:hypothetical protein